MTPAKFHHFSGIFLFFVALTVYGSTLCPGAFPGESALAVVKHMGLDPFPSLTNPLWSLWVQLIEHIPWGTTAFRLNLFSALCGSLSVWLLFWIAACTAAYLNPWKDKAEGELDFGSLLAGWVAALFLLFCIPFWIMSTRAYPLSFGTFLLLLSSLMFIRAWVNRQVDWLYPFVFFYGLGMAEFTTFFMLAPIYGLLTLLLLALNRKFNWRRLAALLGCLLPGCSVYLVMAFQFQGTPAFEWNGADSYLEALWYIIGQHKMAITHTVPRLGWILVAMVMVAPLPCTLYLLRSKAAQNRRWPTMVFLAELTILGLLVLFNFPLAPWSKMMIWPLLVTPYILAALWMGYLLSFWWSYLNMKRLHAGSHFAGHHIHVVCCIVLLLVAGRLNAKTANGRSAGYLNEFAGHVVDSLEGRGWLITHGLLDNLIRLEAHERGTPLTLINPKLGTMQVYRKYLASHFPDQRMKKLAWIGIAPLFKTWLSDTESGLTDLAIMPGTELWTANNRTAIPYKTIYLSESRPEAVLHRQLFDEHRTFWDEFLSQDRIPPSKKDLAGHWTQSISSHLSKIANDLGVFLEDQGKDSLSYESYGYALLLDANNVAARLNQISQAKRKNYPELEKLEAQLATFLKKQTRKYNIFAVTQIYGQVRAPEAYIDMGKTMASVDQTEKAMHSMKRALQLGAPKTPILLAMAALLNQQEDLDGSTKNYHLVLSSDPNNWQAILGLTRIAIQKGEFKTAQNHLDRLNTLQAPEIFVEQEKAILFLMAGEPEFALDTIRAFIKKYPGKAQAWLILAAIAAEINNEKLLEECVFELGKMGSQNQPVLQLVLGQTKAARGDLEAARNHLKTALRFNPAYVPAMELLLRIEMMEQRYDEAGVQIKNLLLLHPDHPLANHMMGTFYTLRKQYDLAESFIKVSVKIKKSADVLNDLAWAVYKQGRLEEALALVEEAIGLNPRKGAVWDTRGVILYKLDRLDESEASYKRTLELSPDHPITQYHLALLYEKKGQTEAAQKLMEEVKKKDLPDYYFEEL